MKGTHTQQRREKQKQTAAETQKHRPPGVGGEEHQLLFLVNNFPVHFRGPSALGFLESEASLCLSWSDSKGTRVSPQGPRGVTYSGSTFPNTELLLGVPGARKPWARSFLLRMSPLLP